MDVAEILVDARRESVKSAETSISVAFLAVMFMFVHGLEGDYQRDLDAQVARVRVRAAASTAPTATRPTDEGPMKISLPPLGLEGNPYSVAMIAMVLYWVFTFRAGFRVRQAQRVGEELSRVAPEKFAASRFYPSITAAGRRGQAALCAALAALAIGGWLFMQQPLDKLQGDRFDFGDVLAAALHLIPAGYLAYRLFQLNRRESHVTSAA